jgi:CheY-like chemotaxis protein
VKTILVVDNEPHILKLVSFTLKSHGFEVLEASDGLSAIDTAVADQPDLILMDVVMPVLSGYEASERLKNDPRTSHIPIMMLSARSQPSEQNEGLERGALSYITKPFTPNELVRHVTELIGT